MAVDICLGALLSTLAQAIPTSSYLCSADSADLDKAEARQPPTLSST